MISNNEATSSVSWEKQFLNMTDSALKAAERITARSQAVEGQAGLPARALKEAEDIYVEKKASALREIAGELGKLDPERA